MMQPIVEDEHGTVRFKSNEIVRRLLEESQTRGFGLNELAGIEFAQEDWEQFAQLIGYSIKGYHELSYVSTTSALLASSRTKEMGLEPGGCREHGCPIHCKEEE